MVFMPNKYFGNAIHLNLISGVDFFAGRAGAKRP